MSASVTKTDKRKMQRLKQNTFSLTSGQLPNGVISDKISKFIPQHERTQEMSTSNESSSTEGDENLEPESASGLTNNHNMKHNAVLPNGINAQRTAKDLTQKLVDVSLCTNYPVQTFQQGSENLTYDMKTARNLGTQGNKFAQAGNYLEAIKCYSDGIFYDSRESRLYANRSYCYEQLNDFENALADALRMSSLHPSAKAYFRQGKALMGLKRFEEAEKAFVDLLKVNESCEEAASCVLECRIQQLVKFGLSWDQAKATIMQHRAVDVALDNLAKRMQNSPILHETFDSDDEEMLCGTPPPKTQSPAQANGGTPARTGTPPAPVRYPAILVVPTASATKGGTGMDKLTDPRNPLKCATLWVGNISKSTQEKSLLALFAKHGTIKSSMVEKHYAFINYADPRSASEAMLHLQGKDIGGQKLLIKFPDRAIGQNATVLKKPIAPSVKNTTGRNTAGRLRQQNSQEKVQGPLPNGECYFWRTTGCTYGDDCRHKHVPENEGIDKQIWMGKNKKH